MNQNEPEGLPRQPSDQRGDPLSLARDPALTRAQKVELLRAWSYDEREIAVADEEGMGGPKRPSNLTAIQAALRELGAEDEPTSHKQ